MRQRGMWQLMGLVLAVVLVACRGEATPTPAPAFPTATEVAALLAVTDTPLAGVPETALTPADALTATLALLPPVATPTFPLTAPPVETSPYPPPAVSPGASPTASPPSSPTALPPEATPSPTPTASFTPIPSATAPADSTPTTPSPTPTPFPTVPADDDPLGEEVRVEEGGFTFRPILGYEVEVFGDTAAMFDPNADPIDGPFIFMTGGIDETGLTLEALLASLTEDVEADGGEVTTPVSVVINGVTGLRVDYTLMDEVTVSGGITVLLSGEQLFTMVSSALESVWLGSFGALHEAVQNSVTLFDLAAENPPPDDPVAGVVWRVGGPSDTPGALNTPGGLDIDEAAGRVYVADSAAGIWVYDLQGNEIDLLTPDPATFAPFDVKVGANGNLYTADIFAVESKITVISPAGDLLFGFGDEGEGDGEFGSFSPESIAIGPDGVVYALDENVDAQGNPLVRIQKFSAEGAFLGAIPVTEANFFLGGAIAVGLDNHIYLASYWDDAVFHYGPDGAYLGTLGETAIDGAGPSAVTLDDAGLIYVSVIAPAGILKLDATGALIDQFGVNVNEGDQPWSEGSFYSPEGVAVRGDGSLVVVSDWSGDFAYVTAFGFGP